MKNKLKSFYAIFARAFSGTMRVLMWSAFAIVTVFSLAGFLSDTCTPCELLSHFRAAYAIAFAFFAATFAFLRSKRAVLAATSLLLLNLVPILNLYVPPAPRTIAGGSDGMRILQFNLQGSKNKE